MSAPVRRLAALALALPVALLGAACSSDSAAATVKVIGTDDGCEMDTDALEAGTTDFELEGGHADALCSTCHDRSASDPDIRLVFSPGTRNRSYPAPKADDCLSCHVDTHDSVFTEGAVGMRGASCATCAALVSACASRRT